MLKFYHSPRSSATRCHVALEELGLPYEKIRVRLDQGEQKTPEYLAINPNGKIPALVDGDVKVFESLAIILYLGARYGVDRGMWPGSDDARIGEALSWSVWASTELHGAFFDFVLHGTDVPWAYAKEHRSAEAAADGRKRWSECVAILDRRLEGREFLLGRYTLADTAVGSLIGVGPMLAGLPLEGKNVKGWVSRLYARPAFARVMSEQ